MMWSSKMRMCMKSAVCFQNRDVCVQIVLMWIKLVMCRKNIFHWRGVPEIAGCGRGQGHRDIRSIWVCGDHTYGLPVQGSQYCCFDVPLTTPELAALERTTRQRAQDERGQKTTARCGLTPRGTWAGTGNPKTQMQFEMLVLKSVSKSLGLVLCEWNLPWLTCVPAICTLTVREHQSMERKRSRRAERGLLQK